MEILSSDKALEYLWVQVVSFMSSYLWYYYNIFRFIDEFCVINDNGLFEKHFREIFLEDLELK